MPHAYGWRPDKPDQRDHLLVAEPVALPAKVSLRSKMPPVFDQGQLGSCTANAIAGALEYEEKRQGLKTHRLSRLFVYYNERAMEGTVDSDAGAEIRDGIKSVGKLGAPPETLWPYNVDHFAWKPPKTAYAAAVKHEALSYARVGQVTTALQAALASGCAVVFGFTVYESFESEAVASSGRVPMPGKGEKVLGGHAVVLVGYDNTSGAVAWEVRNSWGKDWGDKGYFWMPCAYPTNPNLASDFWNIRKAI
jgi:C1A family cysteine protease